MYKRQEVGFVVVILIGHVVDCVKFAAVVVFLEFDGGGSSRYDGGFGGESGAYCRCGRGIACGVDAGRPHVVGRGGFELLIVEPLVAAHADDRNDLLRRGEEVVDLTFDVVGQIAPDALGVAAVFLIFGVGDDVPDVADALVGGFDLNRSAARRDAGDVEGEGVGRGIALRIGSELVFCLLYTSRCV